MTLRTAAGTQALIALEDAAPDVLFERLRGSDSPFWPQVRCDFMVALQSLDFGSSAVESTRRTGDLVRQVVSAFLPSARDPRRLRGTRPIVHLLGGTTSYVVEGSTRNWLVGDYLDAYPEESLALQWAELPEKPTFEPTRSLSSLRVRSAVHGRLARGRAAVDAAVEALVTEFARLLDPRLSAQQVQSIAESASFAEHTRRKLEPALLNVLDRVNPRLALIEDASYGTWASLIAALKHRAVRVVEPQHGWIGPTHGAYNFGAAMGRPELAATLPDELLAFGSYWSSGIRVPYATTDIGKPHLETMARQAPQWSERPHEVLLVSSINDPEGATEFALALADRLPAGWLVRFRPHPSERPDVLNRYATMLAHPRVELDEHADVYVSLSESRGVVGVASTVLFEALALGCRVFARESAFAPYYVGDLFGPLIAGPEHVDAVVEGLRHPASTVDVATLDAIWKPGAVANFRTWMDATLGP